MSKLTSDGESIEVTPNTDAYIVEKHKNYRLTLHKTGQKTIVAVWLYDEKRDEFDCVVSVDLNAAMRDWKQNGVR